MLKLEINEEDASNLAIAYNLNFIRLTSGAGSVLIEKQSIPALIKALEKYVE